MISKGEATKDTVQVLVEATATHVGHIATIITNAVRDVAREIGELASEAFEMREASQKAIGGSTRAELE